MFIAILTIVALALGLAHPGAAVAPLILRVTPTMSLAPAVVRVTTRVEPNDENRSICVSVVNTDGAFEANACRDTDQNPPTWERIYTLDEPGRYTVRAELRTTDVDRPIRTQIAFDVKGGE